MRVIAKTVQRYENGSDALQLRQSGDTENELAGAAGDDDATSLAAMKCSQFASQNHIAGVWISLGICMRNRRLRHRTRAVGVAVGREVKHWQTKHVGAAVDAVSSSLNHCRIHRFTVNAIINIATKAINTLAIVEFEDNFIDFCVSNAFGALPDAFKVYTSGLESWIFKINAIAAIGQPLLGDGVLTTSCHKRDQNPMAIKPELEPDTSHSSAAVMRAGNHDSTSSARAAHLPAHSQFRPL